MRSVLALIPTLQMWKLRPESGSRKAGYLNLSGYRIYLGQHSPTTNIKNMLCVTGAMLRALYRLPNLIHSRTL